MAGEATKALELTRGEGGRSVLFQSLEMFAAERFQGLACSFWQIEMVTLGLIAGGVVPRFLDDAFKRREQGGVVRESGMAGSALHCLREFSSFGRIACWEGCGLGFVGGIQEVVGEVVGLLITEPEVRHAGVRRKLSGIEKEVSQGTGLIFLGKVMERDALVREGFLVGEAVAGDAGEIVEDGSTCFWGAGR